MIYAVPSTVYVRLDETGALTAIQNEIANRDIEALRNRVLHRDLVQVDPVRRYPAGLRVAVTCAATKSPVYTWIRPRMFF